MFLSGISFAGKCKEWQNSLFYVVEQKHVEKTEKTTGRNTEAWKIFTGLNGGLYLSKCSTNSLNSKIHKTIYETWCFLVPVNPLWFSSNKHADVTQPISYLRLNRSDIYSISSEISFSCETRGPLHHFLWQGICRRQNTEVVAVLLQLSTSSIYITHNANQK